jgi:hypothetical protein
MAMSSQGDARLRDYSHCGRRAARPYLFGRSVKYRLVFRFLVLIDQAETPADEGREIFRLAFFSFRNFSILVCESAKEASASSMRRNASGTGG